MKKIKGIKNLAAYASGKKCAFYTESKVSKEKLEHIRESYHDPIKEKIRNYIKSIDYNAQCAEDEVSVRLENGILGKIDLFCMNYEKKITYVIEIKSYDISKFNIRDCYQLLYYVNALMEQGKLEDHKFVPLLIYKTRQNQFAIINLENLIANLPRPQIYHTKALVPGYWCRYCGTYNCPFNSSKSRSLR